MWLIGALSVGVGVLTASGVLEATPYAVLAYGVAFVAMGLSGPRNRTLLIPVALLVALGFGIIQQIAPGRVGQQAGWLLVGGVAFLLAVRPPVAQALFRQARGLAIGVLILLIATIWVGNEAYGAKAWLQWYGFSFQPVEFLKIAVALLAARLSVAAHIGRRSLLTTAFIVIASLAITLWQRDVGPLLVLLTAAALWGWSVGLPRRMWVTIGALLAPLCAVIIAIFPHIQRRLVGWWDPWSDPYASGYQTLQSLLALARGGLLGEGWRGFAAPLPAAATDLPAVILGATLGVAGIVVLLACYGALFRSLFRTALGWIDPERRVVGFFLTCLLVAQTGVILAGSVRLVPLVGVTLPLVSYGGSSLVATLLILGLIASLNRHSLPIEGDGVPVMRERPWYPTWGGRGVQRVMRPVAFVACTLIFVTAFWVFGAGPSLLAQPIQSQLERNLRAPWREGIVVQNGEAALRLSAGGGTDLPPFPSLAHIVGYADAQYGVSGLEAAFDDHLLGRPNSYNWLGNRLFAQRPQALHITISPTVQSAIEAAWPPAARGAVVVLDPWSGEILGIMSAPGFSVDRLDEAMKASPTEAPLFNRALQGRYPPGSTWKLLVMAAALEAGLVDANSLLEDAPSTRIDGKLFRNAGGRSGGSLRPEQALALSSNVIFAELALRIGGDALRTMASDLGVGRGFDLPLPHARGGLDGLDTPVGLAAAGIGQGEILVTPLEMAVLVASIANGGYSVQPRIVADPSVSGAEPLHEGRRLLSAANALVLRSGMRAATMYGTASGRVDATLLAGKTGTAETGEGEPHAWFVGFAPAASPRLVVVVLVEHGGTGSGAAAPIAEQIVRWVIDGVTPVGGD